MSFINFSKDQLANLAFASKREILQANVLGCYASSSLANCNTRKYHGLLVAHQPQIDDDKYILLSSLDESIVYNGKLTELGSHYYPDVVHPQGYHFLNEFTYDYCPEWKIQVGEVVLKKELLLSKEEEQVLIRYTVLKALKSVKIQFNPLLAYRKIHQLNKSNNLKDKEYEVIENGLKIKMYHGFSPLYLQFSRKSDFIDSPHWYYNIEYPLEKERGYDFQEDLFSPGHFSITLKQGEQLIFSASLKETNSKKLKHVFESEYNNCTLLNNLESCLEKSAAEFIVKHKKGLGITAGYPWFGVWGRDTFIALPGLTLSTGKPAVCKAVIDTMLGDLKAGLFPNISDKGHATYNTADASLWFFWCLQQYSIYMASNSNTWFEYGEKMKSILDHFKKGTNYGIHMEENGLLYAGEPDKAVTWMDAIVDGRPVTPRIGLAVELNALWYNAICFALESATAANDYNFVETWSQLPPKIEAAFNTVFWNENKGYLADYVNGSYVDWSIRPNQIFAVALPYSPLTDTMKKAVLKTVEINLLTSKGLRTLSRDHIAYKGVCHGTQKERDYAYHQGTVWPWLLGHFMTAWQKLHGKKSEPFIQSYFNNFKEVVKELCLGTVAEIYDGDAPYKPQGAVSQAWSVAELLRIRDLITAKHHTDTELNGKMLGSNLT
jgi:predicted glycogen debranching enzyme